MRAAFILKVLVTSILHLDSTTAQLSAYGATSTSMPDTAGHAVALSSQVKKHSLDLAD